MFQNNMTFYYFITLCYRYVHGGSSILWHSINLVIRFKKLVFICYLNIKDRFIFLIICLTSLKINSYVDNFVYARLYIKNIILLTPAHIKRIYREKVENHGFVKHLFWYVPSKPIGFICSSKFNSSQTNLQILVGVPLYSLTRYLNSAIHKSHMYIV